MPPQAIPPAECLEDTPSGDLHLKAEWRFIASARASLRPGTSLSQRGTDNGKVEPAAEGGQTFGQSCWWRTRWRKNPVWRRDACFLDKLVKSTRRGQLEQACGALSFDPKGVRDALGKKNASSGHQAYLPFSAAEADNAIQHAEDLVFNMVNMQRRTKAWRSNLLDQGESGGNG